jgi:curved DNA-binding protein
MSAFAHYGTLAVQVRFDPIAYARTLSDFNRNKGRGRTLRIASLVAGGDVAMADGQPFIDYYDILGVSQTSDSKTLEAAYRRLAKKYHPDRTDTADTTKFSEVIAAFRVLRNADQRAEYDALRALNVREELRFSSDNGHEVDQNAALNDGDDHVKILMFLYKKRREDAQNAGVIGFYLQNMLNCSDEHFEFHKWYLKEKGFIAITEQGTLAITIQGVDHVIAMSRTTKAEKLLITQLNNSRA